MTSNRIKRSCRYQDRSFQLKGSLSEPWSLANMFTITSVVILCSVVGSGTRTIKPFFIVTDQNSPLARIFSIVSCFWVRLRASIPYFIKCNMHTSIVHTWISQWFLAKFLFLFFKYNFTRINHCKFIHHKSHLKPFLSYLPCIVCREYFSIIFNLKKCAMLDKLW